MTGRKKWLILSLVLVCGLILSVTLLSGGDGTRQVSFDRKMPLLLRQLVDLYKDFNVQKLSQVKPDAYTSKAAAVAGKEKQDSRNLLQKWLAVDDAKIAGNEIQSGGGAKGLDKLIDPVLQQRWGNPSFDVGRGVITASSDPRALESSYLKIRKTWKKGSHWMAFCEFAIFKAEEIAGKSSIHYLSLQPPPELQNNLGSASTGAPRLRMGQPGQWKNMGYTGNGVIVGDVDTGVDWSHGDFLNENGNSRILYLWDTSVDTAGRDPETLFGMTGFDYGTVYTKADIDNGLCTEFDPASGGGHGTHTLGTATGNGGATGNYTGMAPNADIIFVKGLDAMGVEFIFEMASRLGRPVVVNNSWGISWTLYGPFYGWVEMFPGDGSDEYSQYFDYVHSVYPSGAIIVKSAGNNGMWQSFNDHSGQYGYALYDGSLHFGGSTTQSTPVSHVYHRIPHTFGYGKYLEYSDMMIRSDVPVRVQVTLAGGSPVCTMSTGGWGSIPGANTISPYTYYDLDYGIDPYNGEYMGFMWFDVFGTWTQSRHFPDGDWTIQVTPLNAGDTANYDVWLYSRQSWFYNSAQTQIRNYYDSCFTTNSSHDEYQLDWAASPDAITTGAWTTRNEWLGADGLMHYPWAPYNLEPLKNTITYFSSPGPSRDGRMKPDIAAPGAIIMSTRPSNLAITDTNLDPDLQHQWMWGTSMAAPHSTGGIALILQKFPGADTNRVRGLLRSWARNDSYTRSIGRNGFGAGKLNVMPLNSPPVAVISADKAELVLDNNETAAFSGANSYDPEGFPLTFSWSLVSAPSGAAPAFSGSGQTASLVPDPNIEGTYQVGLVVNDTITDSEMAMAAVVAKFFPVLPPANALLQRLESDFIFYKEYTNKLTWQANAENKTAITAYKLYRKVKSAADSTYILLASLPPTTFTYEDKGLKKDQLFTYKLTSLNSRGKESDPIVFGN